MRSQPPRAPRRLERLAAHARDRGRRRPPRRRWRLRERCCGASGSGCTPTTTRLAQRRARLPARDRQPRLPPRTDRRHHRRRDRATCFGWKGDVIVPVGQDVRQHAVPLRHLQPRALGRRRRPRAVHAHRRQARRHLRGAGHRARPVRRSPATSRRTSRRHRRAGRHAAQAQTIRVNHPLEIGRRLGLPARQRLRPGHHGARRGGHGALPRRDAVPRRRTTTTRRSARSRCRAAHAQAARLRRVLPADRRSSARRPGPQLDLPRRLEPAAGALGLSRATSSPSGRPQSVYTLDTEQHDPDHGKPTAPTQLRILARAGPDLRAARRAGAASPSTASSASPACRSAPTPARRLTLVSALLALAGLVASWSSVVDGSSSGLSRGAEPGRTVVSVGGLAKDDDERARGSTRSSTRADRTRRHTDDRPDQLAQLSTPTRRSTPPWWCSRSRCSRLCRLPRALVPHRDRVAAARQSAHERDELRSEPVAGGCRCGRHRRHRRGRRPGRAGAGRARGRGGLGSRRARPPASRGPSPARHPPARLSAASCCGLLAVHRWPLGNMYEFAVFGAMFAAPGLLRLVHPPRPALARALRRHARCCSTSAWRSPSGTPTPPS